MGNFSYVCTTKYPDMYNEIKIEESQYEFITKGFIRPVAPVRRFSQGNNRFYYRVEADGEITLFSSGTTLIKDGYAESEFALEEWRNKLKAEGKDPVYELMYAAMRGTLLHVLAGDFIQQKQIPLQNFRGYFAEFHPDMVNQPYFNEVLIRDTLWLQKGMMAFAQFVKDYNVKPLAIELILTSEKYGVASPVDLICQMTIEEKGFFGETYKSGVNKGQPKESKQSKDIIAIVDFKSAKAFYDKHKLQLLLYEQMAKECYPNVKVEALYNWSPKEWTGTTPSYNLKEQSGGKLAELSHLVFEQGATKHRWKEPTVNVAPEFIAFGQDFMYNQIPLKQFLKDRHGEERTDKASK